MEERAGAVLFKSVDAGNTRITLKLDADPDGAVETIGTGLGFLERRVNGDPLADPSRSVRFRIRSREPIPSHTHEIWMTIRCKLP